MHNGHIHRVYFVTYLTTQTASLQPHERVSFCTFNAWLCGVPERQRRRVRQQPLVRSRHVRAMLMHTQTNKEPLYPRNSRKLRSMATIWLRGTVLKRPSLDIK